MKVILNPAVILLLAYIVGPLYFTFRTSAQNSGFSYQGRLSDGASPANGIYDFSFALYDASTNGSVVAGPLTYTYTRVSNGLFSVILDFDAAAFTGADRWLAVSVRTNDAGRFTGIYPLQQLTPTPYAFRAANFSGTVAASQLAGTISSSNIGAGSITTAMLATGAVGSNQLAPGSVTTAVLANNAVTASKLATIINWSALKIAPGPGTNEFFGSELAAVGSDHVLIGALGNDTGARDAGAAYLFRTDGTLLTTVTNPYPGINDMFGLSMIGVGYDRVLIAARGNSTGVSNAGVAYLFSTNGTLLTTFTNPTPAESDVFGTTLAALGNDRVFISAPPDDTGAPNAGVAYLFSVTGKLLTTLTNPAPAPGDTFGNAMAVVGTDRVLIAAFLADIGTLSAGAAYLFNTNGMLLTTFTNPAPRPISRFGQSVATIGDDRVLIGAPGQFLNGSIPGAAYLFSTNGTLLTTFLSPAPSNVGNFGHVVAALGSDRVLIGGAVPAAIYLFSTDGTLLTTFTNPAPAPGVSFGRPLAAMEDRFVVGAYSGNTAALDRGAAYVFSIEMYIPGLIAEGVRNDSITTASLQDRSVTAAKIGGVLLESLIPNLDAAKITSGTLSDARLSSNVTLLGISIESNEITDGTIIDEDLSAAAAITDTKLATISSVGKVADSALSPNIARRTGGNIFAGDQIVNDSLGVGTLSPKAQLHVFGNAIIEGTVRIELSADLVCDTNRLTDFKDVHPRTVLQKVLALPVREWRYTNEAAGIKHLGPTGQDFYESFALGTDGKSIGTLDEVGVALTAIQGLHQKVEDDLATLRSENAALKLRLEKVEELLKRRLENDPQ
jgi:hypothetical protein